MVGGVYRAQLCGDDLVEIESQTALDLLIFISVECGGVERQSGE